MNLFNWRSIRFGLLKDKIGLVDMLTEYRAEFFLLVEQFFYYFFEKGVLLKFVEDDRLSALCQNWVFCEVFAEKFDEKFVKRAL